VLLFTDREGTIVHTVCLHNSLHDVGSVNA